MQNSEFVAQLTQFSSLEQLMLIREALERFAPPFPEGGIFPIPPPPSTGGEIGDRGESNRPAGTDGAPAPEVTLEPGGTGGGSGSRLDTGARMPGLPEARSVEMKTASILEQRSKKWVHHS